MTASCSPIQRDVKPVGADSLIGSIPIAHHRNAGTYDSLCSPLQSLLVHREAAIIGTCIETSLGRLGAERMQALARTLPSPIIGI